jgi:hypothetical protein
VEGDTLNHYVFITFDPDKTGIEIFRKALESEEFFPQGEPVFIK